MSSVSGKSHTGKSEGKKFFGGRIEPRDYQISLFEDAIERNTLIVLPTAVNDSFAPILSRGIGQKPTGMPALNPAKIKKGKGRPV